MLPDPSRWGVLRLRDVADLRVSNIDKHEKEGEVPVRLCNYVDVYKNDRIIERIPFMRATAAEAEVERFRLRRGDVLITKDSETWTDIGVPALVEYEAPDLVSGYHLALLRPRSARMQGAFLFRALQSADVAHEFHVRATGVTRFGLSHADIKSVPMSVPSLAEQAAIVRFLNHADLRIRRAIHAKQKLIALLNEQKQAVIDRAVTRGLDASGQVRPSGVDWLGDLPAHWDVRRSKQLFRQRTELARKGDIQLSATQAFGVIPQAEYEQLVGRKVTRINLHLEKRRHVETGDFVISMRSFQGGLERAHATGCVRSSYVVLQPGDEVDPDFFTYVFKSRAYISALQATANFIRDGQDMNFSNFAAVPLAVPTLAEQAHIAREVRSTVVTLLEATDRASAEITLLGEYRRCLITEVVTGRVDVRVAAAQLPDESDEPEPLEDELDLETVEEVDAEPGRVEA